MDATGARELRRFLETQEHWRQAAAVHDGRQPARDPDAYELEEIGDGVRYYGCEERWIHNGGSTRASVRVVKRLVDGWWETSYELEPDGSSRPTSGLS